MQERRAKSPSRVAAFIGLFFVAYGVFAMFFDDVPHPLYATGLWALAVVWFVLAWISRKGTRP